MQRVKRQQTVMSTLLLLILALATVPALAVDEQVRIIVGFEPGATVFRLNMQHLREDGSSFAQDMDRLRAAGFEVNRLLSRSAASVSMARSGALMAGGNYPDLNRWGIITVKDRRTAEQVLQLLSSLPTVDTAYIKPRVYPAGYFKPVAAADTPKFVRDQHYLRNAPTGLSVKWAWKKRKAKGQGVTVADIEGDWNIDHIDLKRATKVPIDGVRVGGAVWLDHGTAEIGLVIGTRNSFGIQGIAFKSDMRMYSIFRSDESGDVFDNIADAVDRAVADLEPGDVMYLPIEFRDTFSGGRGFAVEYFDDVFEAIQAATAEGLIVIEAAGNGGLDLDSPIFENAFNRKKRGDSGALIVGAGGASGSRELKRLSFSNYGSRVDVQNWGEDVVTTGYGDLYSDGRDNDYTASFNGTSSASGLTAGVVAVMQSYAMKKLKRPLTPGEVSEILKDTGIPQEGNANGEHIGPRPNLKKAIKQIARMK